ncbi:MAG: hypothetical protein HUJ26_21515 [Planctomycetaceae bacterium]|nr:hypothetical protein [Planctomycetaceae bacterium]
MTFKHSTSELPLLTAGLPRTMLSWLRAAGIPSAHYRSGRSFYEFLSENSGRFVLYDGRNPMSRAEAETALQFDREMIDVSPNGLLDSQGYSSQHPFRFQELAVRDWLWLVHQEIKHHQGVWLRIHDLPTPYEAIIFTDGYPHQPELNLVADSVNVLRGRLCEPVPQNTFEVEHIFYSEDSHDSHQFGCWWTGDPRRGSNPGLSEDDPTVWKVTSQEFSEWWGFRQNISVNVLQTTHELRIVAPQAENSVWPLMVELWRRGHVARFPLTHSLLTLQRSTMVYGLDHYRHSAGLFLSQGHPMPAAPPVSVSA